jgi:hypothetical protein
VNENQYLLDVVDNLNRDLKKLEQIKQTLLFSIGPDSNNQATNLYDSNKVGIQTKLMNIANHSAETISNFVNLSKAAEGGESPYYNPHILNQPYESFKKNSHKKEIQQTLRKGFSDALAREAFSDKSEINEEKNLSEELTPQTIKKDKTKSININNSGLTVLLIS